MRVSLNWLKEYVNIEMSPQDLAERMTMAGLEVEALEPVGHSLQDIVAAKILSVKAHPKADRLTICEVDAGGKVLPVVCGAPNVEKGIVAPLALPGTRLPGGVKVKESRIRGELSSGILLAEDEMGLTEDHSGIMILPRDMNPGESVAIALSLADWALEVSITPNRPDCTSVIGIAREIAALGGGRVKRPQIRIREQDRSISDLAGVDIEDPVGCPRYAAGMITDVKIGPSPFWMRYRLHVSGLRSINNVVDVTNFVLLELGQPLHAFDYHRLKENRIVVRRAGEGEKFTTLDGKSHTLTGENLMICDAERSVAVAGIMGGLNSEIYEETRDVLIESAYFDPITIRRGSKKLGISTEASYRFERGIDIEGVVIALQRALMLMQDLAGGKVMKGLIDRYPSPVIRPEIPLRIEKANRFLGTALSSEEMARFLRSLEMQVRHEGSDLIVRPPALRVDITREVDLMEEVARMVGYDRIPVTAPPVKTSGEKDDPNVRLSDLTREIMAGCGFIEVISYSFISPDSAEILGAEEASPLRSFVRMLNPLSQDQSVMRTSLLPGLLAALKNNLFHGEKDLRLFEWGKVFLSRGNEELPEERHVLAGIMTGLAERKEWFGEERSMDFFDAKGAVEVLLGTMKAPSVRFEKVKGERVPGYDPASSAAVFVSGARVGMVGKADREVMARLELEGEKGYLFEVDMESLRPYLPPAVTFEPLARFPAVFRDLSIVVAAGVESSRISEIIVREGKGLVESVALYDLFRGGKLGAGEKALAFRISYRSREGTLDGKEVNGIHERIVQSIGRETGGRLRER
ncbi:MAG: phenylalanine--tRNA ligase subunit beta [Desulfobacteraceae bacterium]|nr:MAG: phenylalanine--tRNA ligase subunit beta [Desulfobacteraceae bacterium]